MTWLSESQEVSYPFIELHDSELEIAYYTVQDALIFCFSHAYLFQNTGVLLGEDHITGWSQKAELLIRNADPAELPSDWPCTVYHGSLETGAVSYENTLPIHLESALECCLHLDVSDDEDRWWSLGFSGRGVKLTLMGEPIYVEVASFRFLDRYNKKEVIGGDGRVQVFSDKQDGSWWKLTYHEEMVGHGNPSFVHITDGEAKEICGF